MTQLREQMINAMVVRGFSPSTHKSYLAAVKESKRREQKGQESKRVSSNIPSYKRRGGQFSHCYFRFAH